ncbi:MAG: DUF4914 family protein [Vallitaleaceae bacterium]|jgi:hypothetical protein|nr:DUF4914 family protein [Vallitaleaceae bacterium]
MKTNIRKKLILTPEVQSILDEAKDVIIPETRAEMLDMAYGNTDTDVFEVGYDVEGQGYVVEATVTRCRNGASVNYVEPYMRRRDPNCMYIADNKETDKEKYADYFDHSFEDVRQLTFNWLKDQELIVIPFMSGDDEYGYQSILIAPKNAAFFAAGLADLQGFIPLSELSDNFKPTAIVYLAPTFRHTHYNGKQVVVHSRLDSQHEVFSFNLYPGPSAKKGIYGILLNIGESENWVTAHASTVKVTTPYENITTIMHEGASGGGKSEMLEQIHRESDGRVLFGEDTVTGERFYLEMSDTCELNPVTDDMAMCPPNLQDGKKLGVIDAEFGWFLRFDHIKQYGTSYDHENLTIHPPEPLIFLNMNAAPNSTILIWEHIEDSPGKTCPNPRVIMPRSFVPGVVKGAVSVDLRSFGVRTPVCTSDTPSYGILGTLQILPPALAWLWRLVAPRGAANPSITETAGMGMISEGVGSYWPFATGSMTEQANLLLEQIVNTPETRYVLIPNQHIGAYEVGFKAQWISREYLARRGSADFTAEQVIECRCPLLGYSPKRMKVDGTDLPKGLLRPNHQLEVGNASYDKGAKILADFFKQEVKQFLTPDLSELGREIIETCLNDGSVDDYVKLIPMNQ